MLGTVSIISRILKSSQTNSNQALIDKYLLESTLEQLHEFRLTNLTLNIIVDESLLIDLFNRGIVDFGPSIENSMFQIQSIKLTHIVVEQNYLLLEVWSEIKTSFSRKYQSMCFQSTIYWEVVDGRIKILDFNTKAVQEEKKLLAKIYKKSINLFLDMFLPHLLKKIDEQKNKYLNKMKPLGYFVQSIETFQNDNIYILARGVNIAWKSVQIPDDNKQLKLALPIQLHKQQMRKHTNQLLKHKDFKLSIDEIEFIEKNIFQIYTTYSLNKSQYDISMALEIVLDNIEQSIYFKVGYIKCTSSELANRGFQLIKKFIANRIEKKSVIKIQQLIQENLKFVPPNLRDNFVLDTHKLRIHKLSIEKKGTNIWHDILFESLEIGILGKSNEV